MVDEGGDGDVPATGQRAHERGAGECTETSADARDARKKHTSVPRADGGDKATDTASSGSGDACGRTAAIGVTEATGSVPGVWTTRGDARDNPPPSLHDFRTAASRIGSAPAAWFERFTGRAWDMTGRSYHIATSRWRLLLPGKMARARECDRRRDRSSRARPADDNVKRQQRRVRASLAKAAFVVIDDGCRL